MPTENTAIVDLLAGLRAKPLEEDPADDVLFAGSRRPGAEPRRMARGTDAPPNLFAMPAPAPLPAPQLAVALPAYDKLATTRVPRPSKKLYLIPIGLGVAAAIVVGVAMGSGGTKAAAAVAAKPAEVAVVTKPAVAAAPTAEPIAVPAAAPAAAAPVAAAPATEPTVPTVTPTATPIEGAMPKDAVAPAEVVPASNFEAKGDATVPTAAAAPAAKDEAADEAPAPVAKKSHKASAHDKRAAKRDTKASKSHRKVATATDDRLEKPEHADDPKLAGNGALKVASGQPREVWVDGRNSKRMTPVRVLLKPGKHKVTLFDKEKGTAKTFEVEIKPNTTTTVSK